MPGRINETLDAWDRLRGNDGASYIKSDEAKSTIMEGFGQLSRGEAPTKIIDYTQNLLSRRMDPKQVDEIVSQMLGHFKEAEHNRRTTTLQSDLRGTPGTEEPVQLGGPGFDESQGAAGMTQPARAPRDATQADFVPFINRKAGDSPGSFGPFMAAPSAIRENEATAGNQLALSDLNKVKAGVERQQMQGLEDLPENGMPNTRQLGLATQGRGLAPFMNNEADNAALAPLRAAQTGLEPLKSGTERLRPGLIGAQTGAANAAAGNSAASARHHDRGLGQGRVERDKDGNPIVTEVESSSNIKLEDRVMAEDAIATAARRRGMTTPQGLARVADDMGYELEGDAELTEERGIFSNGPPKLTGNFSLKPKDSTKTTTKGKADKMPDKAPADKPAPGRIRFNSKGEPIR
jgi:hypothetical protein